MKYHGGLVQVVPKIYIVFWGYGLSNGDPDGVQSYLMSFMTAVGGSTWLNTVTQYYADINHNLEFITNPTGQLQGTWNDNSPIPSKPTDQDIAKEAYKLAQHFNYYGFDAAFIVATAHNHNTPGFGKGKGEFCAWHNFATTAKGPISYTNFPYIPDAGHACGAGTVNHPGTLDGVSIVGGHELAESQTDPFLDAWYDPKGHSTGEIGDKCLWENLQEIPFGNQAFFPTQPLWSNVADGCVQSQSTFSYTGNGQNFGVPANVYDVTVSASGAAGGLGAPGSFVIATIPVKPGDRLEILVGSAGGNTGTGPGGFNGGGNGASPCYFGICGGGGGASDVRRGGDQLTNRVLVAGGGGGVGAGTTSFPGGAGGAAGGSIGTSGDSGTGQYAGGGGSGGTQNAGGTGGAAGSGYSGCSPGSAGAAGTLGLGGNGGAGGYPTPGPTSTPGGGGGGGGGGYYGGGGGGGAGCMSGGGGGGGGSSYIEKGATHPHDTAGGGMSGDGYMFVSWCLASPCKLLQ